MKVVVIFLSFICYTIQVYSFKKDIFHYSKNILSSILPLNNAVFKNVRKDMFRTDFSFLIADLKYNNDMLKILELGEGPQSGFQGFDLLYQPGIIWRKIWLLLTSFNMPIWFVGRVPLSKARKRNLACDEFIKIGGRFARTFKNLEQDPLFKLIVKSRRRHEVSHEYFDITSYHGVLIFNNHGKTNWYKNALKRFKKKHPGFLVINDASTPFVNSKYMTSLLFKKARLQNYRPICKRYAKQYTHRLAEIIKFDFPGERYVIKPTNAANGWGVIIAEKNKLDDELKHFLVNKEALQSLKDESYRYWVRDTRKYFLVEEFVTSHPVWCNKKPYDGTMRMVYVLQSNKQLITHRFLGCCWKLPAVALNEHGSFMEKHKSKYGAAVVSLHDKKGVEQRLNLMLPRLYKTMLFSNLRVNLIV